MAKSIQETICSHTYIGENNADGFNYCTKCYSPNRSPFCSEDHQFGRDQLMHSRIADIDVMFKVCDKCSFYQLIKD